jgi:hypothetical protein
MRRTLIRDRIVLDFFEKEVGKREFGTFGLSRGAINVAMTAGVEHRLKYNVMVLGGTDVVEVFRTSDQKRMRRYAKSVSQMKGITVDQFYEELRKNLKTDPRYLAGYLNAKNSLLILSAFDSTVPFKYGMRLRRQIGYPRTIVLLADHYTSVLYTQMVKLFPPDRSLCIFPFDYIEGQTVDFFAEKFRGKRHWFRELPLKILRVPLDLTVAAWGGLFGERHAREGGWPEEMGEVKVVQPPDGCPLPPASAPTPK